MRKSPYLLENFKEFKSYGFDNWSNNKIKGTLRDDQTEARYLDYNKQKQLQLQDIQKNLLKFFCQICKNTYNENIEIKCNKNFIF